MRTGLLIVLLVGVGCYGWFDVRNRARLDRGLKRHRTDFTVYQYAARALVRGEDPYDARSPRGYRYVYPPLFAVLLMPVADWEPENAALLWFAASLLAFVVALRGVARWPFGKGGSAVGWKPALVAGVVVCLGFAHQGFQRGQVTHLLLALQVLALTAILGRRFAVAGLLLGLATALRLTPALAAGAVGLGLLAGARIAGVAALARFTTGLVVSLGLGLVVVPVLALGADRASAVTERWLDVTQAVYAAPSGALTDLDAEYAINEFRFKNQAPRRVGATWTGWATGAEFERERPALSDGAWAGVDTAARIVALLTFAFVVFGAVVGMRGEPDGRYATLYALAVLVPVLMTRYAWPTHFLMAMPAIALAVARPGRTRTAALLFFGGAAFFYAAHFGPLQVVGEAGCLMLATLVFVGLAGIPRLRGPA